MTELTPEQEFSLVRFKLQIQQLTREEAQERLAELYEQLIHLEARYIQLLGKAAGISQEF